MFPSPTDIGPFLKRELTIQMPRVMLNQGCEELLESANKFLEFGISLVLFWEIVDYELRSNVF